MGRTSDANERLMDAALALIWEQSYGAITIDVICQKADVKKGSFYYFFDSKSDLAVAALERFWQEQKIAWDNQFSSEYPPLQRIRNHCDAVYLQQRAAKEAKGKVLGCPFCTLGSEICKQDELIRAKVCEILDSKMKYWQTAIADAQREGLVHSGSVSKKAACAVAYFEGLLAQARLHDDVEALAILGDRVCNHIISCSLKEKDAPVKPDINEATARTEQEEFDSTKY